MTKKVKWMISLGVAALLTLVFAGTALAQNPGPTTHGVQASNQGGLDDETWEEHHSACMGGAYGHSSLDGATMKRVAELLKTTTQELQDQIKEGKSLKEIAESKGISLQALLDTILAPYASMLAVQVEYGYLTQEEANTLLANAQERLTTTLSEAPKSTNGTTPGRGWGMMGGFGGYGSGTMGGMMGGSGGYSSGMMGGMMGGSGGYSSGMMGGFPQ